MFQFNKWWILKSIYGGAWFSEKVFTVFGYPICGMWYEFEGPYGDGHTAFEAAKEKNGRD